MSLCLVEKQKLPISFEVGIYNGTAPSELQCLWVFFRFCLFIFREWEREGEREGEKHPCVRNTETFLLSHTSQGCLCVFMFVDECV